MKGHILREHKNRVLGRIYVSGTEMKGNNRRLKKTE
jgi:hypothetical protein